MTSYTQIRSLSAPCLKNIDQAIKEGKKSLIHFDLLINIDYSQKNVTIMDIHTSLDFRLSAADRREIFKMF